MKKASYLELISVQFSFRVQSTDCTHLIIWRQFHSHDTVDVFLYFGEEVVPSSDQATSVLIADQVQLIASPDLTHLNNTLSLISTYRN